jgi:hypothetical protein
LRSSLLHRGQQAAKIGREKKKIETGEVEGGRETKGERKGSQGGGEERKGDSRGREGKGAREITRAGEKRGEQERVK